MTISFLIKYVVQDEEQGMRREREPVGCLLRFLAFLGVKGVPQARKVFSKIILWSNATRQTNGKLITLSEVI